MLLARYHPTILSIALFSMILALVPDASEAGEKVSGWKCDWGTCLSETVTNLTTMSGRFEGAANVKRDNELYKTLTKDRFQFYTFSAPADAEFRIEKELTLYKPAHWPDDISLGKMGRGVGIDSYIKKDGKDVKNRRGYLFDVKAGDEVVIVVFQERQSSTGSYWTFFPQDWTIHITYREMRNEVDLLASLDSNAPEDNSANDAGKLQRYAALDTRVGSGKLKADGKSKRTVRIGLFEKDDDGNSYPLKGKKISLTITPDGGQILGSLTNSGPITDAKGWAETNYVAPEAQDLPKGPVPRAQLVVQSPDYGLLEMVHIDLFQPRGLDFKVQHPILPAHRSYRNALTFHFEDPQKDWGKDYKAFLSATGNHGRLATGYEGIGKTKIEVAATSGADNVVYYHWEGSQPSGKSFSESITVEIPELELKGTVSFAVGVDLAIRTADLAWMPPFQPGLTIPLKVTIEDRLNPDADLGRLFDDFDIEPKLVVKQEDFSSQPLFEKDAQASDALSAAVGKFIEQSTFGDVRAKSFSHDLYLATVRKTKDGQWLLLEKDLSGEGLNLNAYPAIIPYARGTYEVSVAFDPLFNGDAAADGHRKLIPPIDVSRISARQGELDFFLLPTLKGVASLTNAGGLVLGATDIALKVRQGDYRGAIVDSGAMVFGKLLGDKLSGKMSDAIKGKFLAQSKAYYQKMVAKALASAGKPVPLAMEQLALQLAKPYKLAQWAELVTGWAVGQTLADVSDPLKSGALTPENGANGELDLLAAIFIAQAHAVTVPDTDLTDMSLDYLQAFMEGFGDDYALFMVTRSGLEELKVINQQGQTLQAAPHNVYAGTDPREMIIYGDHLVVVPYAKGASLTIDMKGNSSPVKLFTLSQGVVKKELLDFDGQPWSEHFVIGTDGFRMSASDASDQALQTADSGKAMDLAFWSSIKDSNNPTLYQAYLAQFPNGVFAVIAREQLKDLVGKSSPADGPMATPAPAKAKPDRLTLSVNGISLDGRVAITNKTPPSEGAIRGALPGYHIDVWETRPEGMLEVVYKASKNGKAIVQATADETSIYYIHALDASISCPQGIRVGDTLGSVAKDIPFIECFGGDMAMAKRLECIPQMDNDVFAYMFALDAPLTHKSPDMVYTIDKLPPSLRLIQIRWQPRQTSQTSAFSPSQSQTGTQQLTPSLPALQSSAESTVDHLLAKAKALMDQTYRLDVSQWDAGASKALKIYHKAANMGSAEAWYRIGYLHETGTGVKKDNNAAIRFYEKAGKGGYLEGYVMMMLVQHQFRNYKGAAKTFFLHYRANPEDAFQSMKDTGYGPEVYRAIQRVLKKSGHYLGPIDGVLGSGSRKAIDAYVQGKATVSPPTASVHTKDDPEALARKVQQQLKRVNCYHGAIDGKWGSGSTFAMEEFNLWSQSKPRLTTTKPTGKALETVTKYKAPVCVYD